MQRLGVVDRGRDAIVAQGRSKAIAHPRLVLSRAALVPQSVTDWFVAGGLALAVTNAAIMRWTTGMPAIPRGAGFSYSLYAIHLPVCIFIGALMECFVQWPTTLVQPDARGILAFIVMTAGALVAARGFAYLTEDNTAALREWLTNLRASLRWQAGRVSGT